MCGCLSLGLTTVYCGSWNKCLSTRCIYTPVESINVCWLLECDLEFGWSTNLVRDIGVSFHPFSFSNTDNLRAAWKRRHNVTTDFGRSNQINNQHDDESSFLSHNWVVDVWFYVWIINIHTNTDCGQRHRIHLYVCKN